MRLVEPGSAELAGGDASTAHSPHLNSLCSPTPRHHSLPGAVAKPFRAKANVWPDGRVLTSIQLQEASSLRLRNRLLALHSLSRAEKQRAPGWAMGMAFDANVKPCSSEGDATAAAVCSSAQHHTVTGVCRGQQPICVPPGTKASVLCRAGVGAAAHGDKSWLSVAKASPKHLGSPSRTALASQQWANQGCCVLPEPAESCSQRFN